MPTLEELIQSLPGQLAGGMKTPAEQQAMADQLVSRQYPDILKQYGDRAQQINESAFGRGMGLSAYNLQNQQANTQAQLEAQAKAKIDAQQAVEQAQRAAVGQAASYASGQQQQQQQAQQFGRQLGATKSNQSNQMLASGIGAAAGGIAKGAGYFGPDIKAGLKGLMGSGGARPGVPTGGRTPSTGQEMGAQEAPMNENPAMPQIAPLDYTQAETPSNYGMGDFTMPQVETPAMDFGSGMDFSGWGGSDTSGYGLENLINSNAGDYWY